MDLADLHIFKTVVEEGGIVRAARKLHRVQSSITMRIKQLESSLGAELFYRSKQRLHLSPSGELLLDYAERLLRLSDEARQALSGSAPRGVFRLGALESTTASRLPGVLASYHAACPQVRVELTTGTNDALTAAVAERRLDAAFVAEAPTAPGLAHQPLFTERLVLISSTQRGAIRGPQDVEGDSLIAFPSGCAYRRVLQRWLGAAHTPATRVLELGSYHAIVACVASGTGIALVPESVLDTVNGAEVRRHRLPRAVSHVVTPLIWRNGEQSAPLLALRELLAR
ncbi:LysR family transcriptional regulator [Piscinibacter sp. XHJ-5]|uniref:LysR family transcriptional regulator n=1 Tax=Piscinibacter sp. XHJ-5 TaxID=3037797 RepID=UPI002452984D|nr:LysR family transcriptional regulator [Piscinibacter sp. XHJ-5]